nr:hypothetical protein [Frankia sp. Cas4]
MSISAYGNAGGFWVAVRRRRRQPRRKTAWIVMVFFMAAMPIWFQVRPKAEGRSVGGAVEEVRRPQMVVPLAVLRVDRRRVHREGAASLARRGEGTLAGQLPERALYRREPPHALGVELDRRPAGA